MGICCWPSGRRGRGRGKNDGQQDSIQGESSHVGQELVETTSLPFDHSTADQRQNSQKPPWNRVDRGSRSLRSVAFEEPVQLQSDSALSGTWNNSRPSIVISEPGSGTVPQVLGQTNDDDKQSTSSAAVPSAENEIAITRDNSEPLQAASQPAAKPGNRAGKGRVDPSQKTGSSNTDQLAPAGPSRVPSQKGKEEKLKMKIRELQELIKKAIVNPNTEFEAYITTKRLRDAITRDEFSGFFKLLPRKPWGRFEKLYDQFLLIIATLISLDWQDWDKFDEIFYHQQDKRDNFTRCDRHMPFKNDELTRWFGHAGNGEAFYSRQFLFKPYVFEESDPRAKSVPEVSAPMRLPLLSKEPVYEDTIYKVVIDAYGLKQENWDSAEMESNQKAATYAMKVFKKKTSFEDERRAHNTFKRARDKHRHIVVYKTSFIYLSAAVGGQRRDYCSLYPWADTDLNNLFFGQRGKYGDIFSPRAVLNQMGGLLDGLKFLHAKGIIHCDIKPDNILVFALGSRGEESCGVWKFTDFGLSRERLARLNANFDATIRGETSSVPAPREGGPYQPPELIRYGHTDKISVKRQTDMYSFGAVLDVCRAFLLNGPLAVEDFRLARRADYGEDGWCRRVFTEPVADGSVGNAYDVKPEVSEWRQQYPIPEIYRRHRWPQLMADCSTALLNPNRELRPLAFDLQQNFETMAQDAVNCPQAWEYTLATNPQTNQEGSTPHVLQSAQSPSTESACKAIEVDNSFFSKLETGEGSFMSTCSTQWAAFISPQKVSVYHVPSLLAGQDIWQISISDNSDVIQPTFWSDAYQPVALEASAAVEVTYLNAALSGEYLALTLEKVIEGRGKQKRVEFWDLSMNPKSVRTHEFQTGCLDVIVSAKGVLAFVFENEVRVTTLNKTIQNIPIPNRQVLKAAFCYEGQHLCVWSAPNGNMDWRVYRYNEQDPKRPFNEHRACWRHAPDISLPADLLLAPTSRGPNFFACTGAGQYWFITWNDAHPEKLQVGTHDSGLPNLTIPFSQNTALMAQKDVENGLLYLWALTYAGGVNEGGHPVVEVTPKSISWDSNALATIGSAQKVKFKGKEAILVVHKTGMMELRTLI